MSPITLGILAASGAGGAIKNFIAEFTDTASMTYPNMAQDDAGNYVFAYSNYDTRVGQNGNYAVFHYFDSGLNLIWKKQFTFGNNYAANTQTGVTFDSSGNVIAVGSMDQFPTIMKLSKTDGSLLAHKQTYLLNRLGAPGYGQLVANSTKTKFAFPINHYRSADDYRRLGVAVFDSNLNLTFERQLDSGQSRNHFGSGVWFDSSDNVYFDGNAESGGYSCNLIGKINSSGTLQWVSRHGGDTTSGAYGTAGVGSYIYGFDPSSNYFTAINQSNGTKASNIRLSSTVDWTYAGMTSDASNVYLVGNYTSNNSLEIAKMSTSSIVWSRNFALSGTSFTNTWIHHKGTTPDGDITVAATWSSGGTYGLAFLKIPADGSLTQSIALGPRTYTYGTGHATLNTPGNDVISSRTSSLTSSTTTNTMANVVKTPLASYTYGEL